MVATAGVLLAVVGADTTYFNPPRIIWLTRDSSEAAPWLIARPPSFAGGENGRWKIDGDSIEMSWGDGTTAVVIRGVSRHDSIIGVARAISDVIVPEAMQPTARVTAVRSSTCP